MVRKRDPFWEHVEILANGRVHCKFCAEEFAGGSSRNKSHLSGKKGGGIKICQKIPRVVQFKVLEAIGAQNIEVDNGIDNHNMEVVNVIGGHDKEVDNETISTFSPSSSKPLCSSLNPKACKTKKDKELVDKKLAKFILSVESRGVAESPIFIDFVKGVADFGHDYELPDEEILNYRLIPDLRYEIKKYYKNVKNLLPKSGCTIIFHKMIWWNVNRFSNYRISAYTPNRVLLLYETCESEKILCDGFEIISNQIDKIGNRHVIQFLTSVDLGSVRSSLINKYPWMNVTDSCAIGEIVDFLDKICAKHHGILSCADQIFRFVHIHCPNDYFKRGWTRIGTRSLPFKFFRDCIKNAASFWKLKSLLELENKLQNLSVSLCCEDRDKKLIDRVIDCKEFWNDTKELVSILQPLFQAVTVASHDSPSIGYLFEILERAKAAISQCCDNNQDRYKDVLELFNEARGKIIHPVHEAAAFLNPACKVDVEELKDGMQFISQNLVLFYEGEAFDTELQQYRHLKGSPMFTKAAMMSSKSIHPRIWWDKNGDCFSVL